MVTSKCFVGERPEPLLNPMMLDDINFGAAADVGDNETHGYDGSRVYIFGGDLDRRIVVVVEFVLLTLVGDEIALSFRIDGGLL